MTGGGGWQQPAPAPCEPNGSRTLLWKLKEEEHVTFQFILRTSAFLGGYKGA